MMMMMMMMMMKAAPLHLVMASHVVFSAVFGKWQLSA
jgi:hypothetical protein